ncbi:cupin domain-containing protein [Hufsiella ginkgonis]|uniref:Cupin domain-containing protein n=1 Tax=Hufsiella ginkgonis TaxID=2695274 RepID=A0A7K1XZZ6_9SPHI|nr:cupin domain-containing protein [Hufsiella ginkgonis]MXV16591.1 cupin domain-containing protein [Hufsiella ginkgonis]
MAAQNAGYWIEALQLLPHPEGGFYKEVFRSPGEVLRTGESIPRQAFTSIYYLLEGADYSGFHRIASDEIWYFHKGDPLVIHIIGAAGELISRELSDQPGGNLSVTVPAGLWFAAELPGKQGFTLASCAVAPGFDFREFEMASRLQLAADHPVHAALINRLCREQGTD